MKRTNKGMSPALLMSKITQAQSTRQLTSLRSDCYRSLNHMHLASMTCQTAKLMEKEGGGSPQGMKLLTTVSEDLVKQFSKLGLRQIANCIWAWGKAQFCPHQDEVLPLFINRFLSLAQNPEESSQLVPHNVSNVFWALGRLQVNIARWNNGLCLLSQTYADRYGSQELSNTLWAMAALDHKDEVLVTKLYDAFLPRVASSAKPNEVAIFFWASAMLSFSNVERVDMLIEQIGEMYPTLSGQGVANVLWALATYRRRTHVLLEQLCEMALVKAEELSGREMGGIIWSYATLKYRPQAFYTLCSKLPDYTLTGRSLSTILWGLATLSDWSTEGITADLFRQLVGQLRQHHQDEQGKTPAGPGVLRDEKGGLEDRDGETLSVQSISNTLWALSKLRYYDEDLLAALCTQLVKGDHGGLLKPQEISNPAWALAYLRYPCPDVFRMIAAQAVGTIGAHNNQELCNLAWAFAVAGQVDVELLQSIWVEAATREGFSRAEHQQLLQCALWLETVGQGDLVNPVVKDQCVRACRVWKQPAEAVSSVQRYVGMLLADMGLQPQMEYVTEDQLFCIDIALNIKGRRVAVEVDGESHFSLTQPYRRVGSDHLRDDLLQRQGWVVVHVPFFELEPVKDDVMEVTHYLQGKLEDALDTASDGGRT